MNRRFRSILAFFLVLLAVCGVNAQKKYDIKSGIITFENKIAILGKAAPQSQILYFDDYGRRERKELYEGDVLREAYVCDGKELFNIVYEESTAYRSGPSVSGTETRFAGDPIPASTKQITIKKLPKMKIAGKLCTAYEMTENGSATTLAGWGHMTLYTSSDAGGIHSASKAVKIEENVAIPEGLFTVPPAFKIR